MYFCVKGGSHLDLPRDASFISSIMKELKLKISVGVGEWFSMYLKKDLTFQLGGRFFTLHIIYFF